MKKNWLAMTYAAVLLATVGTFAFLILRDNFWPTPSPPFPSGNEKSRAQKLRAAFPADARAVLQGSRQFTVLSLNPIHGSDESKRGFHSFRVLGQTTISKPKNRARLLAALNNSVAGGTLMACCFDPRHGVRARHAGKTVDLLICFECGIMEIYVDKRKQPKSVPVSDAVQPMLDRILTRADVPLAKPVH